MQRVVFRADGNSEVGLGHVYRSLALAEMLEDDFELIFIINNPQKELAEIIVEICDQCIELESGGRDNPHDELTEVAGFLRSDDIVVLDGYHFDGEYQKKIRKYCYKVISVDDMHQGHFYSDYIINHCGALVPAIYDKEPYTEILLGEKYALLRPEFLKAARTKNRRRSKNPSSIFLCMGGSDYHNITSKVLQAVLHFKEFQDVNIILGAANSHKERVSSIAAQDQRCNLLYNLSGEQMCSLMQESDIAIAPGSSIAFEICAVGMGFITGYYTNNQHDIVNWLDNSGSASIMGDFRELKISAIKKYIEFFFNNVDISALIENQQTVDGCSADRLRKFFTEL